MILLNRNKNGIWIFFDLIFILGAYDYKSKLETLKKLWDDDVVEL